MLRFLLVVAASAALVGCAPAPPTPGPIHMVGGTSTTDYYIDTGWLGNGACYQAIRTGPYGAGNAIGVYVDDEVNTDGGYGTQANCISSWHAAHPGDIIVAGVSMGHPTWDFGPWGATYSAYEWYPTCHAYNDAFGVAWGFANRSAYIVQWNFKWPDGGGNSGCHAPTASDHDTTRYILQASNAYVPIKMILYY